MGNQPEPSLGDAAILAQGGPIAFVGFSSGTYQTSVQYGTDTDAQSDILYTGPTDENEGYVFPTITNGTADLTAFSADTDAVIGKIELTSYMAQQYGLVTTPVVGDLFNNALAQYVTAHLDDFVANDQRETTTIFGATLLGDSAIAMPGSEPVTTGDFTGRKSPTPHPRRQGGHRLQPPKPVQQPEHARQRHPALHAGTNTGANVTLQIQTNAPYVRVRVFTPFNQNTSYMSGEWAGGLGDMTAIAAVPARREPPSPPTS